ncbi:DNA methyltransferase [Tenacibaculum phage Gundel_1]|uniref:DNA (cytosine-5-)-methyltransferase n=1 Tax=Tenacibaculum phage Gundel_1 TaxID=2745672 RepID=A0A8E5EA38_9CAUD|nr:DNA methyltransferase [Tenacibaculum phage Gundel_1]QQV91463.1 C-5 cytosine-specific DNA methylase [Tenacibaculum phage Gundel_1]
MLDLFTETDIDKLINHIKANYNPNKPLMFVVDLFCGAGGMTEGYQKVDNTFVVACVNHDEYAIKSHHANHPCCIHYTEDITDWNVIWKIESLVFQLRERFSNCFLILHASLECTHLSKAKGGLSRDGDSRTLAFHLEKYLEIIPDYITIENVEEILTNGPLDEDGMIIPELKGLDYKLWLEIIQDYGYDYDYRLLDSADFGEYTSRKRYYGIFAKEGLPVSFPKQTHVTKKKQHLFPNLKPHKAVKEVLDLDNCGISVFGKNKRGKNYVDATITRTHAGVKKTLKEKQTEFLSAYYGASQNGQGITGMDEPCNTLTTKDRFALHHIQYAYSNAYYTSIEKPAGTILTNPKHELVTTKWLYDTQYDRVCCSVEKPSPVIIARQDKTPLSIGFAKNFSIVDHSVELPTDTNARKNLKSFMRSNQIKDITIRPLLEKELLRVQGFPEDYILLGGVTRAKKYIGNAVVPGMAEVIGNEIYKSHSEYLN